MAYWQVEVLLDTVRQGYESKGPVRDWQPQELLDYVSHCQFLVLDDLGAEKPTEWAVAKLDKIIDHRYISRLPTIFTSNLELGKLPLRIGDRLGEGAVCVLKAGSYRRIMSQKDRKAT